MSRSTVNTRINKDRYVELGILSKEYDMTRTEILNGLVQQAYQKLLGEYQNADFA